jgi:bifunctional oligoribonuclease and PAP phosphatase NrnA
MFKSGAKIGIFKRLNVKESLDLLNTTIAMTESQYTEIKKLLIADKKVVITTHRSPDGDAIGSSLGLYHVLKAKGCDVSVIVPNAYPDFLKWMPGEDIVVDFEHQMDDAKALIKEGEILFCLDYNAIHRTGDVEESISGYKGVSVMIDHHPQPDSYATYLLSDTSASSTAQLIYEFVDCLGWKDELNEQVGQCLYAGIVTDTGSFRFPSTSARTHRAVAELMDKGLKPHLIHQAIYDSNTESRLKLLGYCLSEKMKVLPEYKTAYIVLSNDELVKFNYHSGDTEGIVNYALSINGVRFAAIIKQTEEKISMSFRSKGGFSVNQFSRDNFNGGGHMNAAGGISKVSLEDTVIKFESLLGQYKKELNAE